MPETNVQISILNITLNLDVNHSIGYAHTIFDVYDMVIFLKTSNNVCAYS